MIWKFLKQVGFESEGGWDKKRNDLVPDGSIRAEHFKRSACIGEYVSPPFDNYDDLVASIKKNWPTEINHKSGFHVNTSFKTIGYYSLLMSSEFYNHFISCMIQWAKDNKITNPMFHKRLNGESEYCRKEFNAEQQVKFKNKDEARGKRECHLNYCFGQHKTIENRLAPSFLCVDTAISYLDAYLNCVESYLQEVSQKEKPIKIKLIESKEPSDNEDVIVVKEDKFKLEPFSLFTEDNEIKKEREKQKFEAMLKEEQKDWKFIQSNWQPNGGFIYSPNESF